MEIYYSHVHYISTKAYEMLLSSRPYRTTIKKCNCYTQDCHGKFLVKKGSHQRVCYQELNRIHYQNKIKPVMEIIEIRISI